MLNPDDKAPPKDALEGAIALYDALRVLYLDRIPPASAYQAKPRGGKEGT